MAGSYTGGPSELSTSTNLVQVAYDRMAYFALRPELYFDQVADVRATNQAMPGKQVLFTIVNDLAVAPNALSEAADVTPVTFTDSQVTVTLAEYGNALVTSAKLRGTAFVDVDPVVANVIGYNAGVSLDSIARNVLATGTNVALPTGRSTRSAITSTDYLGSTAIRTARARLRAQNVPTFGGSYVGFIHPDVVVDIQQETSTSLLNWRAPHTYSAPSEIWTGDLGQYEGVRWIETPRAPVFLGAGLAGSSSFTTGIVLSTAIVASSGTIGTGTYTTVTPALGATITSLTSNCTITAGTGSVTVTSIDEVANTFTYAATGTASVALGGSNGATLSAGNAVDVYATLIVGRQSLAKAHAMADGNGPLPSIVPGPVTDLLRRYVPLGWYWLGGYSIFRQASVYRLETASSLGADNEAGLNPNINIQ